MDNIFQRHYTSLEEIFRLKILVNKESLKVKFKKEIEK